jgi:hypothetical protein
MMISSEAKAVEEGIDLRDFSRISSIVLARLETAQFEGWDPFDALNSRIFAATPFESSGLARLVWTQTFKRLPINLRWLASIPKTANPVTIALAAEVYRRQGSYKAAEQLVRRLLSMKVVMADFDGCGWGYPFPWQAKAFYVKRDEPNVIATAYVVRELAHWIDRNIDGLEEALKGAAAMISSRFIRRSSKGKKYIAYVAGSDAMVHNANLWGAYILATGAKLAEREDWLAHAIDAVNYSVEAQNLDGSWPYGEATHHQFKDSFHTGYVLEVLHRIAGLVPSIDIESQINIGFNFYMASFFETSGVAKYYDTSQFPIDANAAAQAIIVMDTLGNVSNRKSLSLNILSATVANLWQESKGYFAYQRLPWGLNRIEYPRWTQIWLLLALTIVLQDQDRPHVV